MNAQRKPNPQTSSDRPEDKLMDAIFGEAKVEARVRPQINAVEFARKTLVRWPNVIAKLAE
ncbi:hypothetical protein [Ancylobacter sp. FA202]|uniref:hypothetical protein n=1 Tax=Ancylobacter sp. FA202 TaxID=1111106 RepID=UPI0003679E65|nr:hypothetical protein [Ancylobacter sp. FA202]